MITAFKLRSRVRGTAGALSIAALTVALFVPAAHAQVTLLTAPTPQLSSDGLSAALTGLPGSTVPNPYVLGVSGWAGQTVTFTNNAQVSNGNSFNREEQPGLGFPGLAGTDFLPGTHLLRNVVALNNPLDALTITFAQGVSQVGFNFEPTVSFASTDFTFNVFQAGGAASTFLLPGISNFNLSDGSAPFFGASSANNDITSITVSGVRAGGDGNDFFLGDNFTPPDLNGNHVNAMTLFRLSPPPPVPEPGVMALLAGASLPLGLLALRRRRRA